MRSLNPIQTGVASFVIGALIVVAVFALADVDMGLLVGPLLVLAIVAYGTYRSAQAARSSSPSSGQRAAGR